MSGRRLRNEIASGPASGDDTALVALDTVGSSKVRLVITVGTVRDVLEGAGRVVAG